MPATLLASMGRILWRVAEAHQLDPNRLFADAGLDPQTIELPRARYPLPKVYDAWHRMAMITGHPNIGLEGVKHYRPADLHALGMTFLASANLAEALARIDRYETVLNSKIDFTIVEKSDRIEFGCANQDLPPAHTRIVEDLRNAVILDLARTGIGADITPVEVGFTYDEPPDTSPHRALFNCPLKFSAKGAFIAFTLADSQWPFTARNMDLARESDQILDRLLNSVEDEDQDIVSKVKQVIAKSLPSGTPSEAEVAKSVFTSQRTLHRRLTEQKSNFRALLAEVREELAKGYLTETTFPITEISYLIGFSDVSAFSRAFKRWTGQSPAAYRN